mmetsp:Transcript_869/g.2056  ORF Transcript_869/g.2056 Transcript_869/m.2056 type:complete len:194 (-) Transcript_869:82-663(-)
MTKAEQKKAVQFTRMCKFWRTSECKMGENCTFAHGNGELRPSPKPCFEFTKNGFCSKGQSCRFVHTNAKPQKVAGAQRLDLPMPSWMPMPSYKVMDSLGLEGPMLSSPSLPFRPPPGLDTRELLGTCPDAKDFPNSRRPSVNLLNDIPISLDSWMLPSKMDQEDSSPDASVMTQSTASTTFVSTCSTSVWLSL